MTDDTEKLIEDLRRQERMTFGNWPCGWFGRAADALSAQAEDLESRLRAWNVAMDRLKAAEEQIIAQAAEIERLRALIAQHDQAKEMLKGATND